MARLAGGPRTSMASAAAILMAGFILSRLLGLVRVVIQAGTLGAAGHDAAAFTTAIAVPDTVFTIVSGGALGSSFIPVFAGLLEKGDEDGAWRVASGVLNGVFVAIVAAIVVAELAAPWIVGLMAAPPDRALTLTLTRIMLLQPLFLAVSGILMGLYNSYHRFMAPAIAPLVYNLANIVGLALVPLFHHAVALAAWGVTVGALLQVAAMAPGLSRFWPRLALGRGLDDAGTREVGRLMIPRIIGQAAIQLSWVVTVSLANLDFPRDRPSAAIRLAWNLMALPVGIIGSAVATAAFPTLSGQAARGDLAALGGTVSRTVRTILFLAIPAGAALIVLRHSIAVVLFRHGTVGAHGADLVASSLLLWAVGVPALALIELLPRAFFALKDTWTPVLVNLVTLATAVVLSVVGAAAVHGDSMIGVAVLSGAISITVAMEVVWLAVILRRRLPDIDLGSLGLSALRSLVAAEAMGVSLLALRTLWNAFTLDDMLGNTLLLVVAIPFGGACYIGWAYVVDSPDLDSARALLMARVSRRPAMARRVDTD